MTRKFRYLLPSLAVLSFVGAASAVTAPTAFAAATETAADKADSQKPIDHAEIRIKQIHDKLHITPEEEPKFSKLADVMRENAKDMSDAVQKRDAAQKTTNALDDLKAYETIAQAHADGLKNLVPAFEGLYDSLSDSQKKQADILFTRGMEKKAAGKS